MYTVLKRNENIYKVVTRLYESGLRVEYYTNGVLTHYFDTSINEKQFHLKIREYNIASGMIFVEGTDLSKDNKEKYSYIYILNYNTCCINVIKVPNKEYTTEEVENILIDNGVHIDECSYMISDNELNIENLN